MDAIHTRLYIREERSVNFKRVKRHHPYLSTEGHMIETIMHKASMKLGHIVIGVPNGER